MTNSTNQDFLPPQSPTDSELLNIYQHNTNANKLNLLPWLFESETYRKSQWSLTVVLKQSNLEEMAVSYEVAKAIRWRDRNRNKLINNGRFSIREAESSEVVMMT